MARLLSSCLAIFVLLTPALGFSKDDPPAFTLAKPEDIDSKWRTFLDRLLKEYAALFDRADRALDSNLDELVFESLMDAGSNLASLSFFEIISGWVLPLFLVGLMAFIVVVLDRTFGALALRKQANVDIHGIEWLNNLARAGIVVTARLIPITVIAGLTAFPLKPLFDGAPWTLALMSVILPWLLYRLLHGAVTTAFGFRLVNVSDAAATRLTQNIVWLLRTGLVGAVAQNVTRSLEGPGVALDWLAFITYASVAVAFSSFLFLRRDVTELLAGPDHSQLGSQLRYRVERYFISGVTITILLLILAAFGYERASAFILFRAYGLVFVISAMIRVGSWFRLRIKERVERTESRDEAELYASIGTMVRFAVSFGFVVLGLKLLLLWDPLMTLMGVELFSLGKFSLTLVDLLDATVVVMMAIFVGKIVRAVLLAFVFPKLALDVGISYAINTLLSYAFFTVGIIASMVVLGVDFSSLTVILAALGVGIGLGLQTLTENLVSGFILLFGRSVKKGDVITVNNLFGRVEEVGARSVVLRTTDNVDMLIPTKNLVNGEVVNWSYRDPFVRVHIPVGLTYECNPREVEKLLIKAALSHPNVQRDPAPEVWLSKFGNSTVDFELLVYHDLREITQSRLVGQLNFIIWDLLKEAKIEIPYPQRDLHIKPSETMTELINALKAKGGPD